MNRIILIGNGFDLAHGLKTGYQDFMNDYWKNFAKEFSRYIVKPFEDDFVKFDWENGEEHYCTHGINPDHFFIKAQQIKSYDDLKKLITEENQWSDLKFRLSFKNDFGKRISKKASNLEKWLDIENEYYEFLKSCLKAENRNESVKKLNKDLEIIRNKLIDYLKGQERKITANFHNRQIEEKIYELINIRDISNGGKELFLDDIAFQETVLPGGMIAEEINKEIEDDYEAYIVKTEKEVRHLRIEDKIRQGKFNDYLSPNRTLFLNLNYTHTAERLYGMTEVGQNCELIHLHGKLSDPDSIIFGYGDDMDEHYKKITDLYDNEYLKNIKHHRYLESDNYRNLRAFIDSAPYQIYIMGHSCGNSDRTLLNTIFEHENCISVKPFYHRWKDKDGMIKDNYTDIVNNISRNFNDKKAQRDVVVNKEYCESLIPV
ncbi:MAG: bacteriophage abortive infection AbiH family protein [Bacteroidales bacterium]|jgi:hypothetical protein|nr:bacteriophage abortive infection AbiH family protein [Bacteroidales bacterium]